MYTVSQEGYILTRKDSDLQIRQTPVAAWPFSKQIIVDTYFVTFWWAVWDFAF